MKNFIALLCSCLCYFYGYTQTTTQLSCLPTPTHAPISTNEQCGSNALRDFNISRFPELLAQERAVSDFTEAWIANYEQAQLTTTASRQPESTTLVIPVVFHIVYRNEVQNLSEAQIQSQLDVLNQDFRRTNLDAANTPSEFAGMAADCELEFCLAAEDPYGNATIGITRTETTEEEIGVGVAPNGFPRIYYTALGGRDAWDTERYLNIWVCEFNEGLLGLGSKPGTAYPAEDGVVINYKFFGTVGTSTAPYNKGRTATHEVGHFLNLEHMWGTSTGGCVQDDLVEDTPMQGYSYGGCPVYPQTSCSSSDMFMNFMDYTDDACMNLFTEGQKARILATLNGPRAALVTGEISCNDGTLACPYSPQEQLVQLVCDRDAPVLPDTEIRASLDESNGEALGSPLADVFWYTNPNLSNIYTPTSLDHIGDKCLPNAPDTIYAAVQCAATGNKIPAGKLVFQVFPEPQAPAIIKSNNNCDYLIVPACRTDEVSPSTLATFPLGTTGSMETIMVTGQGGCSNFDYATSYPDCIETSPICNTFSSTDTPIDIPGNNTFTTSSIITIPDDYTVHDLNITNLDISHTYVGDLRVSLQSPSGTLVSIIRNACFSSDDLKVQLDDDATAAISCPPNDGGMYWPLGSLSSFVGESMAGDWTLIVEDTYPLDGGTINDWTIEFCTEVVSSVRVKAQAFLQGAYHPTTSLMRTEIRDDGVLPLSQPYNTAPWNYEGTESISNVNAIPANVVDWVLLEVRATNNTDNVLAIKAGLLTSNGTVIDTEGNEGLEMNNLIPSQDYYLIFRHRNHLDVMSSNTVTLPNTNAYDFTQIANVADGEIQLHSIYSTLHALSAGDFDGNGVVVVGDYNYYIGEIALINNYVLSDCTLDTNVTVNDFNEYRPNASKIGVPQVRY